ncbi:MAG: aspartate aminotransferase family protein, partial [Candidatus Methanofishera endochildressiae]|nr:aspartate aminotransferase family protein [Candidatus Methanofishera endochildressiae]
MSFSIAELFAQHSQEKFALHENHLNKQMVRVLQTIGYDRNYTKAMGNTLRQF